MLTGQNQHQDMQINALGAHMIDTPFQSRQGLILTQWDTCPS